MCSFFPLNANEDVRAATRSALIFVNALMISSAIPSLKNSFSGSLLMLTKARTAMLFCGMSETAADETSGSLAGAA